MNAAILPTRINLSSSVTPYVCLGCRLKEQLRRRYDARSRYDARRHITYSARHLSTSSDAAYDASSRNHMLKEDGRIETRDQAQNGPGQSILLQSAIAVNPPDMPDASCPPNKVRITKSRSKGRRTHTTNQPFSSGLDANDMAHSHFRKHAWNHPSLSIRPVLVKPGVNVSMVLSGFQGHATKQKTEHTTTARKKEEADWEQALEGVLDITRSQNHAFVRDGGALNTGRGDCHASLQSASVQAPYDLRTPSNRWPHSYSRTQIRRYHASTQTRQQAAAVAEVQFDPPQQPSAPEPSVPRRPVFSGLRMRNRNFNPNGIRAQLHRWQEEHGEDNDRLADVELVADPNLEGSTNNMTRLPDPVTSAAQDIAKAQRAEYEAMASFMHKHDDEPGSNSFSTKFIKAGDLVEISRNADVPANIGVYVRRVSNFAQVMTVDGRWIHTAEYTIPYSIPGWVSESMVQPLIPYLPSTEEVEANYKELMEDAYVSDLSVPRHVSAPLVRKMMEFEAEAKEIYRNNAATLDNAHALLAHDTDLRYGSLVSAAATLLRKRPEDLSVTAIFAVRQALTRAGFAFNMDSMSHRITGYLQIRSKEQVRMVTRVCGWLHEWQDDLALTASMSDRELRKHRPKRGATYVYSFLEKTRKVVQESRQDRQPTRFGNIGPSQVRIPVTPEQQSIRHEREHVFTEQDADLIRFMEAWCVSEVFKGLPRLEALPPLILAASGLYEDYDLTLPTGFVFLQELGTLLPYENRVRFDPHLLLPSSQHSKPLLALGKTIVDMGSMPDPFTDSMKHLRHDWGDLPVYCIDEAGAHEIDDGVSVERSAEHPDTWWVHVHIAHPTAFFDRDNPLARMARHMGETIYMPERAYMMLPRWSTQKYFSLGPMKPSLTFSARLDADGHMIENKVQAGIIKNVFRLTPEEASQALGKTDAVTSGQRPDLVLTVGGDPPPDPPRSSRLSDLSDEHVQQLHTLLRLAEKRQEIRKLAGGLFFDSHQSYVRVWQQWERPGLAWEHPYRWGGRRTEGDPVIQLRTHGLVNWFNPIEGSTEVLVREHMLLACEIGARWCADRQIPSIFRGSVRSPLTEMKEAHWNNVIAPKLQDLPRGVVPMAYGMEYLATFGATALATRPFKHRFLGMEAYGKVTSPLRRYGDMIAHWQIDAALRQEASTGQSLVTDDRRADRSFLPFSEGVLKNILVGLQPRENVVTSAKIRSSYHWISQLLFRGFHFGELDLPWKTLRAYVALAAGGIYDQITVTIVELNFRAVMEMPAVSSTPGGPVKADAKVGDIWEVEVLWVDCYRSRVHVRGIRLLERMALLTE